MLKCRQSFSILTICAVLSLLTLNSGIDATVITTSLPTITREIGGANIFGRRRPLFVAMALFAIRSGIAGGAHNVGMLICGRVI
ncbi:major facilitator superfamily MFS_1 [Metarhizium guizhouense ARSEF 977]|uniref:Major facilitator superfamily MFS_1 n=1 Tax=Metarhizium guizhouense (strain ARSEF 977) TaxID=1276136 RepID=A0A0B4GVK9_METGA|nr:major facilitator superfamily MFS_1 [Metarhizium guizhouense ARSEF 977]